MIKNLIATIIIVILLVPVTVFAKQGCCSHHGGVAGCSGVKQLCNDGTLSPTCYCESMSVAYKDYYESNYGSNYIASYNSFDSNDNEDNSGEILIVLAFIAGIAISIASKTK